MSRKPTRKSDPESDAVTLKPTSDWCCTVCGMPDGIARVGFARAGLTVCDRCVPALPAYVSLVAQRDDALAEVARLRASLSATPSVSRPQDPTTGAPSPQEGIDALVTALLEIVAEDVEGVETLDAACAAERMQATALAALATYAAKRGQVMSTPTAHPEGTAP